MGSPRQARALVERLVGLVDLVKVSDDDLAWLYPGQDPIEAVQAWAGTGPGLVVMTKGAKGADAVTRAGVSAQVLANTAVQVADTVGAGDSFMSGLIHALWQRDLLGAANRHRLAALDQAQLAGVLAQASQIAAITVSRAGANPPWLKDLA
jgi:fructokinase